MKNIEDLLPRLRRWQDLLTYLLERGLDAAVIRRVKNEIESTHDDIIALKDEG